MKAWKTKRFAALGLILVFFLFPDQAPAVQVPLVRVGVVIDGPWECNDEVFELFQEEILALTVVEAAQRRLRPILLTTATTVGGLLPLYLGGGPMWEPMAIAIMFGLVFATALTLGLVPILYSVLFRVSYRDFSY